MLCSRKAAPGAIGALLKDILGAAGIAEAIIGMAQGGGQGCGTAALAS